MKTDPSDKRTPTQAIAKPPSQPDETAWARATALAGISAPLGGTVSEADWGEFNRELYALEGRPLPTVLTPQPTPMVITRNLKA